MRTRRVTGWLLPAICLLLVACDASDSPGGGTALPSGVEPIPVDEAATGVEGLDGDLSCAPARPRADDYGRTCSGMRGVLSITIHLFSPSAQGELFGATLYAAAPADGEPATQAIAEVVQELVTVTVPEAWQEPVARWLTERFPDGGRTLDVPEAGITAAVQPLAANQWYVELYELDGRER